MGTRLRLFLLQSASVFPLLSLALASCADFDRNEFRLDRKLSVPLPPLCVRFDEESLKRFFWTFGEALVDRRSSRSLNGSSESARIVNTHAPTHACEDVREILCREVKRCAFTNPEQVPSSGAELLIRLAGTEQHVNSAWMFPTILSLTLLNVLGMPFASQEARVGLELIVKSDGKVIGRYSGIGEATDWAAYYWGYSPSGCVQECGSFALPRAALAGASLAALDDALDRLEKDARRLRAALSKRPGRSSSSVRKEPRI
jgi:hypothetical protein